MSYKLNQQKHVSHNRSFEDSWRAKLMPSNKFTDLHHSNMILRNLIQILQESINCSWLSWWNALCFVIIRGILSHPHWRKQWYYDIVIDNANIIGNIGRGKLDYVFRYNQQMFLKLFSITFCNKVHRVFKIVELWKGIKKNKSLRLFFQIELKNRIEENQEKSKQTKLKKLNRIYITLKTKMNEFFFTFSLVKNKIYRNI